MRLLGLWSHDCHCPTASREARACGIMTTWGDGVFAVHRDLDAAGALVAIRIELAE